MDSVDSSRGICETQQTRNGPKHCPPDLGPYLAVRASTSLFKCSRTSTTATQHCQAHHKYCTDTKDEHVRCSLAYRAEKGFNKGTISRLYGALLFRCPKQHKRRMDLSPFDLDLS
jgi:hypothetical protein